MIPRTESTSEFQPLEDKEVEYFFASDASAVIEHTNRVIYLEVNLSSLLTLRKNMI
jgi:glucosamine--fructose-6-phosphate aminotransferase (isomerizing)